MDISLEGLQRFLRSRAADLKRIVSGARGDVELGDVESEVFVIANEIQSRRGRPFDFDSATDQDTLLGGLWNRIVKFQERYFRYAVKIDDGDSDDENPSPGAALARSLKAAPTSDPALLLQQEQEAMELAERVDESFSEAVAYMYLLRRFDDDKGRLCHYLCIALDTLGVRLRRAAAVVAVQPSVFDGIERVAPDFIPTIDRKKSKRELAEPGCEQHSWGF